MDGGAWRAAVPGVAKGRTRLSDFTVTFAGELGSQGLIPVCFVLLVPGGCLNQGHRVGFEIVVSKND